MGIGLHGYLWTRKRGSKSWHFPILPERDRGRLKSFMGAVSLRVSSNKNSRNRCGFTKSTLWKSHRAIELCPLIVENAFQIFQRQVYQRVRTNIFTSQGKGSPFPMRASPGPQNDTPDFGSQDLWVNMWDLRGRH